MRAEGKDVTLTFLPDERLHQRRDLQIHPRELRTRFKHKYSHQADDCGVLRRYVM